MHKISPTMMFWKLLVGSSLPIKPLNTDILCKTSNALKWRLHVKPFSPARPIWLWRNHFHTWISARRTYNWIHHQKYDTNVFMWVVDCTRRNHILAGWKEGESTSYKFRPTFTQFTTRKRCWNPYWCSLGAFKLNPHSSLEAEVPCRTSKGFLVRLVRGRKRCWYLTKWGWEQADDTAHQFYFSKSVLQ